MIIDRATPATQNGHDKSIRYRPSHDSNLQQAQTFFVLKYSFPFVPFSLFFISQWILSVPFISKAIQKRKQKSVGLGCLIMFIDSHSFPSISYHYLYLSFHLLLFLMHILFIIHMFIFIHFFSFPLSWEIHQIPKGKDSFSFQIAC